MNTEFVLNETSGSRASRNGYRSPLPATVADSDTEMREGSFREPAARSVPETARKYNDLTGAVLHDLYADRATVEALVKSLNADIEREKKAAKAEKEARLAALEVRRAAIRTRIADIIANELTLSVEWDAEQAKAWEAGAAAREQQQAWVGAELTEARAALEVQVTEYQVGRKVLEAEVQEHEKRSPKTFAEAGLRHGTDPSLRMPEIAAEWLASEKEMVLDASDKSPVPGGISWTVTTISGVAAGISLGLAAHFLHPDTLMREAATMAICGLFGIATSVSLKYGLESVWREVSLRLHKGASWLGSVVVASAATLLVVVIYSTVERRGLMSGMMIEMITSGVRGGQASISPLQLEIAGTFGSLFLTVPYALLMSVVGFRKGRNDVHRERAAALRMRHIQELEERQRASPAVQAAFGDEALTPILQNHLALYDSKHQSILEGMQGEVARLESRLQHILEHPTTPTLRQRQINEEQDFLRDEKVQLHAETEEIKVEKRELDDQPEPRMPSEPKLKAAEDRFRVLEGRIAYEIDKLRKQMELAESTLLQRLAAAFKRDKSQIGLMEYHLNDKKK